MAAPKSSTRRRSRVAGAPRLGGVRRRYLHHVSTSRRSSAARLAPASESPSPPPPRNASETRADETGRSSLGAPRQSPPSARAVATAGRRRASDIAADDTETRVLHLGCARDRAQVKDERVVRVVVIRVVRARVFVSVGPGRSLLFPLFPILNLQLSGRRRVDDAAATIGCHDTVAFSA